VEVQRVPESSRVKRNETRQRASFKVDDKMNGGPALPPLPLRDYTKGTGKERWWRSGRGVARGVAPGGGREEGEARSYVERVRTRADERIKGAGAKLERGNFVGS
jgi:hypothetical protein